MASEHFFYITLGWNKEEQVAAEILLLGENGEIRDGC
jgi:hypothetical protein